MPTDRIDCKNWHKCIMQKVKRNCQDCPYNPTKLKEVKDGDAG